MYMSASKWIYCSLITYLHQLPLYIQENLNNGRLWDVPQFGLRHTKDNLLRMQTRSAIIHTHTHKRDDVYIDTCGALRDAMRPWGWCMSTYTTNPCRRLCIRRPPWLFSHLKWKSDFHNWLPSSSYLTYFLTKTYIYINACAWSKSDIAAQYTCARFNANTT